jgi:protein-disulfide isomerase
MRSSRLLKSAVLSVAVGSALLLSGCAGSTPQDVPSSSAGVASEGKVIVNDANKLTVAPGSTGVVFTEFTDFQCPSCASVHGAVENLADRYEGKIDLAVRNLPLSMHQNAKVAAYAVEAAVLQSPENLRTFSDKLYTTQEAWGNLSESKAKEYFVSVAEELGLDKDKFVSDSDSQKVKDRVAADVADATALKLQGTPSMFIGTTPIDLRKITSDADMDKLVDAAIAEAAKSGTATPAASATTAP